MASIQNNSFNIWHFSEEVSRQSIEVKIHNLFYDEISADTTISKGPLSVAVLIATVAADIFTLPFRGAWHLGERCVQWINDNCFDEAYQRTGIPIRAWLKRPEGRIELDDNLPDSEHKLSDSPNLSEIERTRRVAGLLAESEVTASDDGHTTDITPFEDSSTDGDRKFRGEDVSAPQPISPPSSPDCTSPVSESDEESEGSNLFCVDTSDTASSSDDTSDLDKLFTVEISVEPSSDSEIPLLVAGPTSDSDSETDEAPTPQLQVVTPSAPFAHIPVPSGDQTGVREHRSNATIELESFDLETLFHEESPPADSSPVRILNLKAASQIDALFDEFDAENS